MVVFQESCAQPEVTVVHPGGGLNSYRKTQRYCNVYPLRGNQDPAPSLHYCFLTAFPLFLHSLTFLMSNSLNLPFETQGRSEKLKFFPYKQETGHRETFVCKRATQGPARFQGSVVVALGTLVSI